MIPFSDQELVPVVEKSLDKVRPSLALDGGGVELLGIKNAVVYVRLGGACHGCSSSGITLKNGIEYTLKSDIHPDIEVVNIPPDVDFDIETVEQ
jgi:Fe-S cluster biogenesis protein NfuA